jgi:UDP-N-acetylmuramate--alanine ligase
VDDYAHHPTEVKATLEAAAGCWPDRRLIAVFQPHLYSRTEQFAAEFGQALLGADVVIVMDVYGARERPVEGVSGQLVADRAGEFGHRNVSYVPDKQTLPEYVASLAREGDVVLTLGAGDIWRSNRKILELLEAREGSA